MLQKAQPRLSPENAAVGTAKDLVDQLLLQHPEHAAGVWLGKIQFFAARVMKSVRAVSIAVRSCWIVICAAPLHMVIRKWI